MKKNYIAPGRFIKIFLSTCMIAGTAQIMACDEKAEKNKDLTQQIKVAKKQLKRFSTAFVKLFFEIQNNEYSAAEESTAISTLDEFQKQKTIAYEKIQSLNTEIEKLGC